MDVIGPVLIALGAVVVVRMTARLWAGRMPVVPENCSAVASMEDLERILARNGEERSLLFLHDPWCPVSRRAAKEVGEFGGPVELVDVSQQHQMSREIEARTGIKHESPQVIILASGVPVWNASHGDITSREIEAGWSRAADVESAAD